MQDLADLLTKMGAQIEGAGTSIIRVQGVEKLHGAEHTIIPDRIEAGTFLIAGAIHRATCCHRLRSRARRSANRENAASGRGSDRRNPTPCASVVRRGRKAVDMTTEEYPGFATDLQAQYMALMATALGISFITETIFENRFMHVLSSPAWVQTSEWKAGRRLSRAKKS